MKKGMMILVGLILVISMLVGCSKGDPKPVAIEEGVDRCEACNMMVPNDHNATEIILKDGKPLKFDDLGDLFAWTKENGMDNVDVSYVRDYNTMEWVKLDDAYFVYDKMNKTPMAYGVFSFKDKDSAEKFIQEQGVGELLTRKDLDSHSWERNMEMMKQMKEQMNMGGQMPMDGQNGMDGMNGQMPANGPMPANGQMDMNGGSSTDGTSH